MVDAITKNIVASKLDNVVMTGRVPTEDMASIYASASVLLLTLRDAPSLSATIPSKLQSYLAAGKPIIASCNGESANIVNQARAGLICPAGDANALAIGILKLYEMQPEERASFGKNARKYFECHYELNNCVANLIVRFKNVVTLYT